MIVLTEGFLTEKCNNSVGHLNIILVRGGRNFERYNLQRFKRPGFAGGRCGQGDVEVSS